MNHKATIGITALALVLTACAGGGSAESPEAAAPAVETGPEYPTEQITINSPFDPGGGIDLAINTMIASLNDSGVSDADMRLSNIPGGGGLVAIAQLTADNSDDDSTLLLTSVSSLSNSIQNPDKPGLLSMTPLGGLYSEYTFIYVPASSPWMSLEDLGNALKADPGSVTMTGGTLGSADSIVAALFAGTLGLEFSQLAYLPLSGDENAAALLGGNSDVAAGGPDLLDLVDSGDLRVLAVSAPERLKSERVKDVPTMAELGYDVVQGNWRGLFGPPDMPQYAIDYWSEKLIELAATEEWTTAASENIWDIQPRDSDEFAAFLKDQDEVLTKVLISLGLAS
jgi:putative tricarboxylic transport membrane protein